MINTNKYQLKMYKIYNFIEDKSINLPLTENRAFLYGDGFFETIIIKNGDLFFFTDHYARMIDASIELNLAPFPSAKELEEQILLFISSHKKLSRLKIIIFRNAEGLFAPEKNTPLFYLEEKEIPIHQVKKKSAFFSTKTGNRESNTSRFKTISSLHYVLAGVELNSSDYDEIILLDEKLNISECLSSNIWWIKDNIVYTPNKSTGCITGVARKNIFKYLTSKKIKHINGQYQKDDLINADFCFTSNVAGLHIISSVESNDFPAFHQIFEDIKKALFS